MRRIAAAVVAAGAVTAIVLMLVGGAGAGPLQNDGGYGVGIPVKPGQLGVTTFVLPRTLSKPVTLLAVRPLHAQDARGMTLRYGGTIGRGLSVGGGYGWKTRAWQVHPLYGFVIPAHVRGGVMIGEATSQRGVHGVHGFVIDYKVGGTTYTAPQKFTFDLCVGYRVCP